MVVYFAIYNTGIVGAGRSLQCQKYALLNANQGQQAIEPSVLS